MGGDDLNRFEFYSYYKEEHLQHYYDYALKNPQLQTSDVIWQVNAGLYRPFYEGIEEIKDTSVFPLLVNKYKNCHLTLSLPLSLIFLTRHIRPVKIQ